jgi:hypothetical protein
MRQLAGESRASGDSASIHVDDFDASQRCLSGRVSPLHVPKNIRDGLIFAMSALGPPIVVIQSAA